MLQSAPGRTRTADAGLRTASLCPLSYGGAAPIVPRGAAGAAGCQGFRRGSPTIGRDMDAPSDPLPDLVLYGRVGCHLCDEAHETLTALLDERRRNGRPAPTLDIRDIDPSPEWQSAFGTTIPVVELGDRRLELVTSASRLRRLL